MKLTPYAVRVLGHIKNNEGDYANKIARAIMPDSPAWQRSYKCGASGSHRGSGAVLSMGSYLAKLSHEGWVRHGGAGDFGYYITQKGREALMHSG